MDLRDALKSAGASKLSIGPRDVCLVEDDSVVIPETPNDKRLLHPDGRTCVVLTNSHLSQRVTYPIVSIAPTTSQLHLKDEADFPLSASHENGLHKDCLVMLGHIQPVRKRDLFRKIGTLSSNDWDKLCAHVLWYFDLQD
jgi:mRNA-degrading endonuclease toxin of MazEF toxin-antitoxin module